MMKKRIKHIMPILMMASFLLALPADCCAQLPVVEIRLQASTSIRYLDVVTSLPPAIFEGLYDEDAALQTLRWLEITSPENILLTMEIDVIAKRNKIPRAYYINTGQFDITEARPFVGKRQHLSLNRLAGDDEEKPSGNVFKAWVGLNEEYIEELTVKYD